MGEPEAVEPEVGEPAMEPEVEPEPEGEVCEPPGQLCEEVCVDVSRTAEHCGECGVPCAESANASASCQEGRCVWACDAGFVDTNGDLSAGGEGNGCECAGDPEVCDGLDNNCNGFVDGEDDTLVLTPCARSEGVCTGAGQACVDRVSVACVEEDYVAHAQQQGVRYESEVETSCDGLDNDCDGRADENCCASSDPADAWSPLVFAPLNEEHRQIVPSIAFAPDGRRLVLAWQETGRDGTDDVPNRGSVRWVLGTRDRQWGEPLVQGDASNDPAVSSHGGGFDKLNRVRNEGLLWERITWDGERTNLQWVTDDDDARAIALGSWSDGRTLAAYERNGFTTQFITQSHITEGILDEMGTVAERGPTGMMEQPGVAVGPSGGLVLWRESTTLGNATLRWRSLRGDFGDLREERELGVEAFGIHPTAISVAGGYLLAYLDRVDGTSQVMLRTVDVNGNNLSQARVITNGPTARFPRLVSTGEHIGVLWSIQDPQQLWYQRLDPGNFAPVGAPVLLREGQMHFRAYSAAAPRGLARDDAWFVVAASVGEGPDVEANPERIQLAFFTFDGQPVCFSE